MKRIALTGGTGSYGRGSGPVVARHLAALGYEVRNLDFSPQGHDEFEFRRVDLTHYGDTFAALHGCEAVVHMAAAADPDPDHFTGAQRFHNNTLSTFNVFQAAAALGMERVVWGSSETVLGYPFEHAAPTLLPTDDDMPARPEGAYGMSKAISEDLARLMSRRHGLSFVGLRFSNIFYDDPDHPTGYRKIPGFWDDPHSRKTNLWSYVDVRDVCQSVEKSLTAKLDGAYALTIAAADTIMRQTNADLIDAVYPGCKLKPGTGDHETLIGIGKARETLGYDPQFTWRKVLGMD